MTKIPFLTYASMCRRGNTALALGVVLLPA